MRSFLMRLGIPFFWVGMCLFPISTEARWCDSKAFLGVSVRRLFREEKRDFRLDYGIRILSVAENSPADRAGIEEGDILLEVDRKKMRRAEDLMRLVTAKKPGTRVQLRLFRDGEIQLKSVRLGRRPALPVFAPRIWRFRRVVSRPILGIQTASLNEDLASYFGVSPDSGLLVLSVRPQSAAAKAGLKAGDVILTIEGETVSTPRALRSLLWEYEEEDTLTFGVLRKGVRFRCDVILDRPTPENRFERFREEDEAEEEETKIEIRLPGFFSKEWKALPNRFWERLDRLEREFEFRIPDGLGPSETWLIRTGTPPEHTMQGA